MTDGSTESQATVSAEKEHNVLASMLNNLVGAIKDLPYWQRMVGFALVVAAIPITLAVYSLSSDPNKLVLLSAIFLVWIASLIFIVYAFTERQIKWRDKQKELGLENPNLDGLRTSLLDAVEEKHRSLLQIESRLQTIGTEIEDLLLAYPELSTNISRLKVSVEHLIQDIKENESSYDDFLKLMGGTEAMRESKSVGASILVRKSSKKPTTHQHKRSLRFQSSGELTF